MIISRTPYRISFFGGGTDYPAWYRQHGGAVLAAAIDKYCYLSCRHLPPFFEHRSRIVYSKIEDVRSVDEISHPAVREVLRFLKFQRGLEIHHDGDLPARSGIGSSCAFTVGLLHAIHGLQGQMPSKKQLAHESIHIEQDILKETVGSQDQVSAAYGGLNHITFHTNGEISVEPITIARGRMEELNSHLLLFYTGIKRTAANVAKSYVNNIEDKNSQLKAMQTLVDKSIAALNSHHDLTDFGHLLHETWLAKRSLSASVSNPELDELYQAARDAGALGGKITGAGGGGFMLLFAPPSTHQKIRERLNKLIHVPFQFDFGGSQIIYFDHEADYSEAETARASQSVQAFREMTPA